MSSKCYLSSLSTSFRPGRRLINIYRAHEFLGTTYTYGLVFCQYVDLVIIVREFALVEVNLGQGLIEIKYYRLRLYQVDPY